MNKGPQHSLIRITISVDRNDHAIMERLAKGCELSTSRLIRQAISEFIDRRKEDNKISIMIQNDNKVKLG